MPAPRVQNCRGATRPVTDDRQAKPIRPARCPACKSRHNVRNLPELRSWWYYCWSCNLEFNTKTGVVQRITPGGGVRLVIIDSKTFEVVEAKTIRIKLTGHEKPERLNNVVRLGVYNGFMVFEFAGGRQKLFNAAMVESVEEV